MKFKNLTIGDLKAKAKAFEILMDRKPKVWAKIPTTGPVEVVKIKTKKLIVSIGNNVLLSIDAHKDFEFTLE